MFKFTENINKNMPTKTIDWIDTEFANIDFKDSRITNRFKTLLKDIAIQPDAPINMACNGWHQTKAAYRFFANDSAQTKIILDCHIQETIKRIEKYKTVLVIQDTCTLDYNKHKRTVGLGPTNNTGGKAGYGMFMHTAFACSTEGLPLGILDQYFWARKPYTSKQKKSDILSVLPERESVKWLLSIRNQSELNIKKTRLITITDREGDFYEMFDECNKQNQNFVIRSRFNRNVLSKSEGKTRIISCLNNLPVQAKYSFQVPEKDGQPSRLADMEVKYDTIEILLKDQPNLSINLIQAKEKNPPENVEPIEWRLFTNIDINSGEDAIEKVRWYQQRWQIEQFHKILKSGCRIEDCRLSTKEKLIKFVTINSIVAWRLFYLTEINKIAPDLPCTTVLSSKEWKTLWKLKYRSRFKQKPPKSPPSIRWAVRSMAELGGFLGRKGDGEPGIQTLWRGYGKLMWSVAIL